MKIPISELSFSFSRSSGAGGQNVNKVNSKVTLRWNLKDTEAIPEGVIQRFIKKYSRYILDDGSLIITGQRFRGQARNIADCMEKLQAMLESVKHAPLARRATRPTKGSVEKRLKSKKGKGDLKKSRQRVSGSFD